MFIGIESPRAASLAETKKVQNIRGDSLLDKVQRIRDGGLVVQAGFIVGFDNDDEAIFQDQYDFIQQAGIAQALVAILSPIPTTPLYDRLLADGRLDFTHPDVAFLPARMSREALKIGYDALMQRLYAPDAYFERLFAGYGGSPAFREARRTMDRLVSARPRRINGALRMAAGAVQAGRLFQALRKAGAAQTMGRAYLRAWKRLNQPLGKERMPLSAFVGVCAVHWHFYNMAHQVQKGQFGTVKPLYPIEARVDHAPAALQIAS